MEAVDRELLPDVDADQDHEQERDREAEQLDRRVSPIAIQEFQVGFPVG